uniref:Uncharacterized protein n=1 Tax=Cacopsylla melanoneura TaxID=428564 RepID=A0A8D8R901_9HEMI
MDLMSPGFIQASDLDSETDMDKNGKRSKKKYGKNQTYCKFCSTEVFNFERHLVRKHKTEESVVELESLSKKTKEGREQRRNILSLIRNEGNYKIYLTTVESKDGGEKLPCIHCCKVFSKNFLARHYKKCKVKPINIEEVTTR